ncbi:MAG: cyclic nucleotide-binding domain-containing protein [Desulfopila sp.]|nr:cyclic nucleotide-binding domain-containing protein [Desulfopila sp.]
MILAKLTETEQEIISSYLEEIQVSQGEKLFSPQDKAEGVFFIKSGRLGVQTPTGFADKCQVVALLDAGAPVGEKGLVRDDLRNVTVAAIEDSVLYYLSRDDFGRIEEDEPTLAIKILKLLLSTASLRLQASSQRLAHVL